MKATSDTVPKVVDKDACDVPAIEICDLRVDYGDFVAVDDIRLKVPPGEVCGLVGPNGAGKTSTLRVLATLMEPTYGDVNLCGIDIIEDPEAARRILGYMPDFAPASTDLKAWEFLDFHADTHALGNRVARRNRLDEYLETVSLSHKRSAWCNTLSRGRNSAPRPRQNPPTPPKSPHPGRAGERPRRPLPARPPPHPAESRRKWSHRVCQFAHPR